MKKLQDPHYTFTEGHGKSIAVVGLLFIWWFQILHDHYGIW